MSVQFKSLAEMVSKLEILTFGQAKSLLTKEEFELFRESFEFSKSNLDLASVKANDNNRSIIEALVNKYELYPVTFSIHDGESSSDLTYDTGFTYVNRERFLLCKSPFEGTFTETEGEGQEKEENFQEL